jgi:predicted transposase/invertase (TIGR01784 family)
VIHNPHDALFKSVFGEPEHARGVLRSVVPSALGEVLDWSTLTLRPGSFVDEALRPRHTDLLFSATRTSSGSCTCSMIYPGSPKRSCTRR